MALAYGNKVYEYIAGGPFDDEAYEWDLLSPIDVPNGVHGYVVPEVSPDGKPGFSPYGNKDEIWPVANRRQILDEDWRWPDVVERHFFG